MVGNTCVVVRVDMRAGPGAGVGLGSGRPRRGRRRRPREVHTRRLAAGRWNRSGPIRMGRSMVAVPSGRGCAASAVGMPWGQDPGAPGSGVVRAHRRCGRGRSCLCCRLDTAVSERIPGPVETIIGRYLIRLEVSSGPCRASATAVARLLIPSGCDDRTVARRFEPELALVAQGAWRPRGTAMTTIILVGVGLILSLAVGSRSWPAAAHPRPHRAVAGRLCRRGRDRPGLIPIRSWGRCSSP